MRSVCIWLVCLVALVFSGGCLLGDKTVAVRYDTGKDEFGFLTVYSCVRSSSGDGEPQMGTDFKYLTALYRNRDHLILPSLSLGAFLGDSAGLRISKSNAAVIGLSQADQSLEANDLHFPLDGLLIKPGTFYLSNSGSLCYFHQLIVPGKIADAALAAETATLNHTDLKTVWSTLSDELERRRHGTAGITWKEFTNLTIGVVLNEMDEFNLDEPDLQIPWQTESIQALCAVPNHLVVLRRGATIAMRFPLTATDVAQSVAYFNELQKAVNAKLNEQEKGQGITGRARDVSNVIGCLNVRAVNDTTLEISADAVQFMTRCMPQISGMSNDQPNDAANSQKMARRIAGVFEEKRNLLNSQIKADFLADTLTAYPAQPSVAPGTDLPPIKTRP